MTDHSFAHTNGKSKTSDIGTSPEDEEVVLSLTLTQQSAAIGSIIAIGNGLEALLLLADDIDHAIRALAGNSKLAEIYLPRVSVLYFLIDAIQRHVEKADAIIDPTDAHVIGAAHA